MYNPIKKMNKRGQEEIVGFIVIVVIVTIAAITLLLFSARKPVSIESSQEVENFLQSSMHLTTECQIGSTQVSLDDLIRACYNNEECANENTCTVLNRTFSDLLDNSWDLDIYSGYWLNVYATETNNETVPIMEIKAGQESMNSQAASAILSLGAGRKINAYLKIYAKTG